MRADSKAVAERVPAGGRMPTWRRMVDEMAQLEILELQDRVKDLEGERDSYRELTQSALDVVRRLTRERDDLRALINYWTTERRGQSATASRRGRPRRAA